MPYEVKKRASWAAAERLVGPVAVRGACDGRHDDLDQCGEPGGADGDDRGAKPPPVLHDGDIDAGGREGEGDILPREQPDDEHRPEEPIAVRQDRVEAE